MDFPIAEAMLTAVGLSDELCRAKPGILVATSFSAKLYFDFERIFLVVVFVNMVTAAMQLYCLMEPGTRM